MKKLRNRETWVTLFKYMYLVLLFCSFLNFTCEHVSGLAYLVTGIGVALIVWDLLTDRNCLHSRNMVFLAGLLAVYGISSLLNVRYGLLENIKGFLWMVLQYGLLFSYNASAEKKLYQRQAKGLMIAFCFLTFAASLAGIIMFWQEYGRAFETDSGKLIIRGFMYGRLWGEYTDPNYGSIFAALSLLFSGYLFCQYRKLGIRIVLILNGLLQLSYLALSDSRTALVSLGATVGIGVAGLIYHRFHKGWRAAKTAIVAGVCLLLSAGVTMGCIRGIQTGWSYLSALHQQRVEEGESGSHTSTKPSLSEVEVGREDMPEDVSNQRFNIWGSGFEILWTSPLFGTSPRNMLAYAQDKLPDTYVVQENFNSFHNGFFDVLFCLGIAGIVMVVLFVVGQLRFLVPNLLQHIQEQDFAFIFLSFLTVLLIACSAMFLTEIFLINSVGAFFFWKFLGYLNQYFERARP